MSLSSDIHCLSLCALYTKRCYFDIGLQFLLLDSHHFWTKAEKERVIQKYCAWVVLCRALRTYVTAHRRQDSINTHLLDGSELSSSPTLFFRTHRTQGYTLGLTEMIMICKKALESHMYGIPSPKMPRNPYTNLPFSKRELLCFWRLYQTHHGIYPDRFLTLFFLSHFDVNSFRRWHHEELVRHANRNLIQELDDDTFRKWVNLTLNQVSRRRVCVSCVRRIPIKRLRSDFSALVLSHQLSQQGMSDTGKVIATISIHALCQVHGITYKTHHRMPCHKHRRGQFGYGKKSKWQPIGTKDMQRRTLYGPYPTDESGRPIFWFIHKRLPQNDPVQHTRRTNKKRKRTPASKNETHLTKVYESISAMEQSI